MTHESSRYIKRHVVKVCTKFEQFMAELLTILRILHTLRHAVTLTFDLLTFNSYSTSGIMCVNYVQNLSKIE